MFPLVLAIRRWRMAMRIDIICILVIYTLYDIPGYVPYYIIVCLGYRRALAGVEVLCGRLAAFVLVK